MASIYKNDIMVNIDGKIYNSLKDASGSIGVHQSTISRWLKQINNSGRSEIEFTIKVPKTFTVKKIKEES